MNSAENAVAVFEQRRPFLLGLAYRILGSRTEAEDVVQELFIKWLEADRASIATPAAWLTTACTRHCIDLLRSAHTSRVDYIGTWLPEPIHTTHQHSPEHMHELASSLSTAFLLLLERLTPKERAAYLLYEIFDMDYAQVAEAIGIQEAACRKLVSRAKAGLGNGQIRYQPEPARQDQLLSAFHNAIASGSTASLTTLLAEDVELCADSGGKASAIRETLFGIDSVLDFIGQSLHAYWQACEWLPTEINGAQGVIIKADGEITASLTFGFDEAGRVSRIFIMRNPEKLAGLEASLQVQYPRFRRNYRVLLALEGDWSIRNTRVFLFCDRSVGVRLVFVSRKVSITYRGSAYEQFWEMCFFATVACTLRVDSGWLCQSTASATRCAATATGSHLSDLGKHRCAG